MRLAFWVYSDDGKYELTTRYLGRGNGDTYTDKGNSRWADEGSTIILDRGDKAATRYFVGAEAYRLEKQ